MSMHISRAAYILLCCTAISCGDHESKQDHISENSDSLNAVEFPIMIEGGSKAVYRFAKMTPRGLRYFLDTIEVNNHQVVLPDSAKVTFLSPLAMSGPERDTVPGIIAISVPGLWEETIFGKIDGQGQLYIRYVNEMKLIPQNDVSPKPGNWSGIFRNDSVTVRIAVALEETRNGEHLAGKGKLFLIDQNKLREEQQVIVVFDHNGNQ